MNTVLHEIMDTIIKEATLIAKYQNKQVLSSTEIRKAVEILFPGKLRDEAKVNGDISLKLFLGSEYTMLEQINKGGQASVYKGSTPEKKIVAMKISNDDA